MKKFLCIVATIVVCNAVFTQPLNNEWIDYNKTYYKFKVGSNGLYRITQPVLASVGLGGVDASFFQLWRNGVQVPINTSIASGVFSATDFIEFWGQMNDGKLDKLLYKNTAHQLSDKLSLQTDTAAYFLTINTNTASNFRYVNIANNVAGTLLPAETNFNYTQRYNFRDRANRGYAENYGEDVYSSTYDVAEFLSTTDINNSGAYKIPLKNLFIYTAGSPATLTAGLSGNSSKSRGIKVKVNNTDFITKNYNGYVSSIEANSNVPLATFNGSNDTASIEIVTSDSYDRVVASFLELQYARQYNFGGSSNFEFQLPASGTDRFLQIANFNYGNTALPVLYDVDSKQFLVGDTTISGIVRFVLPASSAVRNLMLASRSTVHINQVTAIEARSFVNYNLSTNQGDYVIISHKLLMGGSNNAVEQYRLYRSGAAGGSYNARIFDIDELVDQFAYGIKKHPLSVRNFLRFANIAFSIKPKSVFIIGKGVTYDTYRFMESNPAIETQNLVPTFGWPASDAMLVSPDNSEPAPMFNTGRLSAITQLEILTYLDKVRMYEQVAASTMQTLAAKGWMKQLVHVAGGKDVGEDNLFTFYLKAYENIITDTSFGGIVANFNKKTGSETDPSTQSALAKYFASGIGLITYFGHSAASGLAYNLNDPNDYSNFGKYPVFLINGCTAGNIYDYDANRATTLSNVSERWVLAKDKGSVAFIAASHFGLTGQLDIYSSGFYKSLAKDGYGKTLGDNMKGGLANLKALATFTQFLGKIHGEQFLLHGDPALRVYYSTLPDFAVEDEQVSVTPTFISVTDKSFTVKANLLNLGKAVGDSVRVLVKRTYPDNSIVTVKDTLIPSVRFVDTLAMNFIIDDSKDKGTNTISITIDSDYKYAELSETNNSITKTFVVFQDELKPVYPQNYAIINTPQVKLQASTANTFSSLQQYAFEFDTTKFFNSPFKKTATVSSIGGALEFAPQVTLTDSTVYYWRIATLGSTTTKWTYSSFVYLQNATSYGYNQSQFFQHTESDLNNLAKDTPGRNIDFSYITQSLTVRNAVWPFGTSADDAYSIAINDALTPRTQGICYRGNNVTFTVYNPSSLKELFNHNQGQPGQYGSLDYTAGCTPGKEYDFAFSTENISTRNAARDFMLNNIPNGSYVVVRSVILRIIPSPFPPITYASDWKADELINGTGNSLYGQLKTAGFNDIDSFNRLRAFAFVYQKNNNTFTPVWKFTQDSLDPLLMKAFVQTRMNTGKIVSPKFGPAAKWYNMIWSGSRTDAEDILDIKLIGIKADNSVDTLQTYSEFQTNNNIGSIDANTYPYLQLVMNVKDTTNLSAYKLKFWRLLADALPEGALAPNINFKFKDSLQIGELQNVVIAFKNIGGIPFTDSLNVKMQVTDAANNTQNIVVPKLKKLAVGDTATINTTIDTKSLAGKNTFYVNVNPANNPKEQNTYNNFAYRNFYVTGDEKNPLLDVTFDGVHILNGDIVSSKPSIRIALKDESKYLLLNDTSLVTIQLKMPNGELRNYKYGTDTLQFIPANAASGDNKAIVQFNPVLLQDGDNYELYVKAKDRSDNLAGPQQYKVVFTVNNKPMLSNLFNYPNPFTTSTAFVFTLTGSRVPDNLRIQILTVTGKVVKEITKQELGNIHIGRNITDYKWDGTDSYGQPLGNGVYLYRVISSLDGKSLDKLNTADIGSNGADTDKYFKAGYGKMYLMR